MKSFLRSISVLSCAMCLTYYAHAQVAITGQVTSAENGESLPGVTVSVKGTTTGTITDFDGNYSLSVDEGVTLTYRFVGFEAYEIVVKNQSVIDVQLETSVNALDEVVVVAYGAVKKRDLTGSISSIKGEEMSKTANTSLDQALQGRAAGVQVSQVSGRPGGETSIRIRGSSSVNAGNEPLYVIDGMLVSSSNADLNAGGTLGAPLNALSAINPSDIESVQVLKDASATALYGARGANGVVLITTKRGKEGRTNITLDSYYGVQTVTKQLELLNGEDFAHYMNDLNKEKGLPSDVRYIIPEAFGEGTDWQEAIFRQAPMQSHQLSISGGNKSSKYSVGGGYYKQDGIVLNSDFERVTFRTSLESEVAKILRIGTNVNLSTITSRGVLTGALSPGTGVLLPGAISSAVLFPSTLPVLDASVEGGYTFEDDRNRNLANPVADAQETDNISKNSRAIGNVFAELDIIDNLMLKINLGFDAFTAKDNRFVPNYLKRTEPNHGEASIATVNGVSWLSEFTLNYKKQVNADHYFDVMGGYSLQGFSSERLYAFSLDFTDNRIGYHNLASGLNPQPASSGESTWGIESFLGRANYNYKGKYLVTVTGRMDGSSKFGEDSKYGFFPSLGLAWNMTDESFIPSNGVIDIVKMRASLGVIGNSDISSFNSLATVGPLGEGTFNNDQPYIGVGPLRLPNPGLRWERSNQFNVGFDLAFYDARLMITTDYYIQKTSDLLLYRPIPTTSGFSNYFDNIGELTNQGFEFAVDAVILDDKALTWNATLNLSTNRNEITKLSDNNDIPAPGVLLVPSGWSIVRVGEPLGTFHGLVSDGIFQTLEEAQNSPLLPGQTAAAGERRYKDINGRDAGGKLTGIPDGVINEADRTIIGRAQPKLTWNLINTFGYMGFDLSVFIQASHGNDVVNAYRFELESLTGETNVYKDAYFKRWTATNPSNEYRKLNPFDRNVFSDAQVEDASFVRIKNVSFGYSLPDKLISKMKLSKFRVYVSGTNLFTLTNYSGYDPEVNAFGQNALLLGIDYGGYPLSRTILAGVQIGI